jgi:hypothetical protein
MAEYQLVSHPDFPSPAVNEISVKVERPDSATLSLTFRASGLLTNVLIPDEVAPGFEDGLWRHSCFEAFLGNGADGAYTEFNLSPSGRYAAYRFDDYRAGMQPATDVQMHIVSMARGDDRLELCWLLQSDALIQRTDWRLALTVVVEALDRTKSYWALAHAPGPPDFHNPDCFIATLPAPAAA